MSDVENKTETAEALVEKLRVAESMLATMQAEKDAMVTKQAELVEPLKAQFTKVLESAPAAVQAKFKGKEIDPVAGLKAIEEETKIYNDIKAEAVKEVQAQVTEYQKNLSAKYGTRVPDISAVFVEKDSQTSTSTSTQTARVAGTGETKPTKPTVGDLATRDVLTTDEMRTITGRLSSMAAWMSAKKEAAIAAKK
jgi:hypothetical protein